MKNSVLKKHPIWGGEEPVPDVSVRFWRDMGGLKFEFEVEEHPDCFRLVCQSDGDPCWQDSCVEVFLEAEGGYYNFETNAGGKTLAEFGPGRENRRRFLPSEYSKLERQVLKKPEIQQDGRIHWSVLIGIPNDLVRLNTDKPIRGNLYKCASNAVHPVYLSLFPIDSPRPDFHRPEFFDILL